MGDVKIVTFGKYRGKPVDSLIADDKYCQWLAAQPRTLARYPWLETLLATGETEQTPVHNKLQARFTDDAFVEAFLDLFDDDIYWQMIARKTHRSRMSGALRALAVFQRDNGPHYETYSEKWRTRGYISDHDKGRAEENWMTVERLLPYTQSQYWRKVSYVEYEVNGADVVIFWRISGPLGVLQDHDRGSYGDHRLEYRTAIECKPGMADDYPAVLRQMKRNSCNVLLIGDYGYTGDGASFEQVEKMFTASNIRIIFLSELPGEPA